jgi:hypothetical protein
MQNTQEIMITSSTPTYAYLVTGLVTIEDNGERRSAKIPSSTTAKSKMIDKSARNTE